jgi:hypothetical protein
MSRINASRVENPQYKMRSQQIMAQRNQHAQAIMQSRQDWFEVHNASMRQASQMRFQSAQAFSEYLKSGGIASRDNPYTTNDQFTDYLRDTTTFNDPYTGHRVTQQGRYDYWFTDRLGNYYGTNDPNFNRHSLRGEWFPITPLGR